MNKLVIAIALAAAVPARADDTPADAMALFDQGIKDLQAGNTEVACKELAASLAEFKDSGTKGALATCYSQLGKVASSWKLWRDLADTAPTADMKRDAAANAYQLEARLPHFVIRLKGAAVPGLKVTVGDTDVADPTLAVPLPVDPGPFTALATAPDYVEWTTGFTAAEGKTTTVEIPALVARPKPPPTAATATGPAAPTTLIVRENVLATRRSRHVIGLSLGVVGVAALVVGGIFGATASSEWSTAQKDCANMISSCAMAQAQTAQSGGEQRADVGAGVDDRDLGRRGRGGGRRDRLPVGAERGAERGHRVAADTGGDPGNGGVRVVTAVVGAGPARSAATSRLPPRTRRGLPLLLRPRLLRRCRRMRMGDRRAHVLRAREPQLDQHAGEAVEVLDREEARQLHREQRVLVVEAAHRDRDDVANFRRRLVAEPFEVGLAERPLPQHAVAADHPRLAPPLRADLDVRQAVDELGHRAQRHRHAAIVA